MDGDHVYRTGLCAIISRHAEPDAGMPDYFRQLDRTSQR
jgi:hypothetical protein